MEVRPITLKAANEYIDRVHRHHEPDTGHKFSIAAYRDGVMCGVAIIGRPKGRMIDHTRIAEVTRLATDGTRNACSFLYNAAARVCREMGYEEIWTYTLASEPGSSLRGAGWLSDGIVRKDGKGWKNRPGRKGLNEDPKKRWRKQLKRAALVEAGKET